MRDTVRVRASRLLRRLARRLEGPPPGEHVAWLFSSPRSGSTWFMNMLAGHPAIRHHDEPLLGAHLGVTQHEVTAVTMGAPQLVTEAMADEENYVFAAAAESSWLPFVSDLARARLVPSGRTRDGSTVTVIKEPHGAHACTLLQRLFPGSRSILLVRDPRDVLDSHLDIVQAGFNGNADGQGTLDPSERHQLFEQVGSRWKLTVAQMNVLNRSVGDDLACWVRYEDLRESTNDQLRTAYAWLGLPSADDVVTRVVDTFSFERVPTDRRGSGKFHRAATPGLWRSSFTDEEHEWAATYFGAELRQFGYEDR